jgi:hypothetical protein
MVQVASPNWSTMTKARIVRASEEIKTNPGAGIVFETEAFL